VIQWNGRSRRERKPPPKTYWEEFVATDAWYVRELVADIPADEWEAAVTAEDWDEEEEGEEAVDMEEGDPDYSEEVGEHATDSGDTGAGDSTESDVDFESLCSSDDSGTTSEASSAANSDKGSTGEGE